MILREPAAVRPQILAVLEDALLAVSLERSLTRRGFGFTLVEGLGRLDTADLRDWNEGFDLLLVDVPRRDDGAVLAALRRIRAAGLQQPIAVLTRPDHAPAFATAGPDLRIDRVLIKPIDLAELAFELTAMAKPPRAVAAQNG